MIEAQKFVTDAYPTFKWERRPNPSKRDAAGNPIEELVPYITIKKPGDPHYKMIRRAVAGKWAPSDAKIRDDEIWSAEWAKFIETGENVRTGTLLENWGALSVEQVEELNRSNLFTIEQLAGLPDHVAHKLGVEGMKNKIRAKAWLDAQTDPGGASKVMADQAAQIASLQMQVKKLSEDATDLRISFDDRQKSHDAAILLAEQLAAANKALGKTAKEDIDPAHVLIRVNAGKSAIDGAKLNAAIRDEGGDAGDKDDIGTGAAPEAKRVDPEFAEEAKDAIPAPARRLSGRKKAA